MAHASPAPQLLSTAQLLTPPAAYPVSIAEVKAQLALATDVADDDARIAGLIAAATEDVEAFLGQALITRSYHGFLDHWPSRREGAHREAWPATLGAAGGDGRHALAIEIPWPPLISIDFVNTYDDSDVLTLWPASNYFPDTASSVGRLVLRRGQDWPLSVPMRAANAIEIGWTCGVGPTLRPMQDDTVRLGVMLTVAAYNEQRGDAGAPDALPDAARRVLGKRRLTWL